jgi:carbon-monoxide dehydrogenase small subunit
MIPEPKVVNTIINGDSKQILVSERDSLLEALRDRIGMTGAKEGCNNGNCGACAVIMDGRLVNSCCVMAAEVEGAEIMTVEGLASRDELHPLQTEFLDNAALQCGICTPFSNVFIYIIARKSRSYRRRSPLLARWKFMSMHGL